MVFSLFSGVQGLGPAGSQEALNQRFERAQRLWPEYPNAWGPQIDAWEFGYEFDPSELGIQEAPRSITDIPMIGGGGYSGEETADVPGVPLWQRAACSANRLVSLEAYQNCLIGMGRAGGLSEQEAYGRGINQSEQGGLAGWITRGAYIAVGLILLTIGLAVIGFVKPRDVENALKITPAGRAVQEQA